jgi:hypothetical protein
MSGRRLARNLFWALVAELVRLCTFGVSHTTIEYKWQTIVVVQPAIRTEKIVAKRAPEIDVFPM